MTRYTISPAQAAVVRDLIAQGHAVKEVVLADEVFPTNPRKAHSLRTLGYYFHATEYNQDYCGIRITADMLRAEVGDKVEDRGRYAVLHKRAPDPLPALIAAARLVARRAAECPPALRTPPEDALIAALAAYDAQEGTPDA